MSTKIYDAYVMDNMSAIQLNKLARTLKKMCFDYAISVSLAEEWAVILRDLSQDILYNRVAHVNNKKLIIYYGSLFQSKQDLRKGKRVHYREAKKNLTSFSIMDRVIDISEYMYEKDPDTVLYSNRNSSIVLFPDKKDIKFQVFGQDLRRLMSYIVSDTDIKDFNIEQYKKELKPYNIRDYHYQNQTDKPDHITGREWRSRKLAWDRLMPSGIPSEDGTVIEIIDNEIMYMNIHRHIFSGGTVDYYNNTIKYIKNIEDRPYSKAKEVLFDRYISSFVDLEGLACSGQLSYVEIAKLHSKFNDEIANKEGMWNKEIISLTSKLRPYTLNYFCDETKNLCTTYDNGLRLQNLLDDSLRKLGKNHIFIQ